MEYKYTSIWNDFEASFYHSCPNEIQAHVKEVSTSVWPLKNECSFHDVDMIRGFLKIVSFFSPLKLDNTLKLQHDSILKKTIRNDKKVISMVDIEPARLANDFHLVFLEQVIIIFSISC